MNHFRKILAGVITLSLVIVAVPNAAPLEAAQLDFYNFNTAGNLAEYFTPSDGGAFTESASGGLGGSRAVDISGDDGLYTSTSSYALPDTEGETLTVSAYFQYAGIESYDDVGIGFVASSSSDLEGSGWAVSPAEPGIGVTFESSYLEFYTDAGDESSFESPELIEGQWYKMVFALVSTGVADTYDMHTQIWNSDANGDLYSLRAWRIQEDFEYAALAAENAGMVYAYFGTADDGQSFAVMDNFEVTDTPLASLWSGAGTEGDPYIVNSCSDLQAINAGPYYLTDDVHFKIGNSDIDCSVTAAWNDGEGFIPIGTKWGEFDGVFDGNYKAITGLTIDRDYEYYQGLFDDIGSSGIVRNLILTDFTVVGREYVGALAGESAGTIEQVGVENASITGEYDVGGLVGQLYSPGSISRSYVLNSTVTGQWYDVGGLVGYSDGHIEDSYSNATVTSVNSGEVGGLVGEGDDYLIERSFAIGSLQASGYEVGGLVGESDYPMIKNSFAAMSFNVDGDDSVGGLVGYSKYGDAEDVINNFYYSASELGCFGYLDSFDGEPGCTEVDSADYFKNITNQPLASWNIELSNNSSYNVNDGYPVLAWQAVSGDADGVWLGFSASSAPAPKSTVSGGRSGGALNRAPASNNSSNSALIQQILDEIRARVAKMIADGEAISPAVQAFLNALGNSNAPSAVRDLELGMEGTDVSRLQNILIGQGHSIPSGATGFFGSQTQAALAAYQSANNIIPAVGYFGSVTRAFMKAAGITGIWW